ncbi:MAG: hypothetical protein R2813_09505 [Flavobacteriales bacterium]
MNRGGDFVVVPEHRLVIERFINVIDLETVQRMSFAIWDHPDYDKYYQGIVDLRDAKMNVSILDMVKLVRFFIKHDQTVRSILVIIANKSSSIAWAFVYKERIASIMNVHVVQSEESATAQLGLSSEVFDLINSERATQVRF